MNRRAHRRVRQQLERDLEHAASWEAWNEAAEALDAHEGLDAWRADDASRWYDAALLREDLRTLASARAEQRNAALESLLTESLYRHLPDLAAPALYEATYSGGTKHLVSAYLEEAARCVRHLATSEIPGLSAADRRDRLVRAAAAFGDSALMLSGGATWGLYHLGVVRALHRERLLPQVICGSSMGAIVAAGVGTRTDTELDALFADIGAIHRVALRPLQLTQMARERALMDPAQLVEHVRANAGDTTFAEARARTGRTLAISVSPTRARQKPRVLSHKTAAEVLIVDATVASCAVPGLFPAASLRARRADGSVVPYAPSERWVDGSLQGDLPMSRVGRLHNVNHFIVSQTNPHVLPVLGLRPRRGLGRVAMEFGVALTRAQAAAVLDTARRVAPGERVRPILDHAHALTTQRYGGDILMHPRFSPSMFTQLLRNPSEAQLEGFVREGARAAWPKLAMVRHQTLLARTFAALQVERYSSGAASSCS